jgi:uncharacterized Zn finger protein
MDKIPHLTEDEIRARSTTQSWVRGQEYFYSHSVENIVWRDGMLTAEVEGGGYEPYIVQVKFEDQNIYDTDCTCPYDWGGDCKHIVATLLYLCHWRNEIEQRPALGVLLADLSREQLVDLILDLSISNPVILEDIERNLPTSG